MSYCRWMEGDLYAYRGSEHFIVRVAGHRLNDEVKAEYREPTAHALLARILWLESKGCDYPWDALRYLKEDIIEEVEQREKAEHDSQTSERD